MLLLLLTISTQLVHLRAIAAAFTSHTFHILFTSSIFTYFISAEHSTHTQQASECLDAKNDENLDFDAAAVADTWRLYLLRRPSVV